MLDPTKDYAKYYGKYEKVFKAHNDMINKLQKMPPYRGCACCAFHKIKEFNFS